MAENTLIEVLRGKLPMQLPFKALVGDYGNRLAKAYGGEFTINDPNLREKLTAEEYRDLCAKYDYLVKPELPPEPPMLEDLPSVEAEQTTEQEQPAPKRRGRKPKQTPAPKRRGRKPKQTPIADAD